MIDNEATRAWLDGLAQQNLGGPDLGNALPVQALEPGTSPTRRSTWCPTPDATSPGSRFRSTRVRQQALGSAHMAPPLRLTSVPVGGDSPPARRSDRRAVDGAGHRRACRPRSPRTRPPRSPRTAPMRIHGYTWSTTSRPPAGLHDDLADAVVGGSYCSPVRRTPACGCADALEAGRPTTRSRLPAPRWPPARSTARIAGTVTLARIRTHRHAALPRLRPRIVRSLPRVPPARTHLGFASGANYRAPRERAAAGRGWRRRRGARDPPLRLARPDRAPLPSFTWQPPRRRVRRRGHAYSLTGETSAPQEYTVSVLNRVDGRGGSRWIHGLSVGDTVAARGRARSPRCCGPGVTC